MLKSRYGFTGILGSISTALLLIGSLICQATGTDSGFGPQENEENQATSSHETKQDGEEATGGKEALKTAPTSVEEARIRARILHEAFGGALQVMHRDYFREDQRLKLPSKSLEDVFKEMAATHQVQLRWLAVNAKAMSVNHKPQNEFEEQVVKELSSGKDEFELANEDSFQFAGSIPLSASCVRCHVRSRTSNAEKKAALVITMPLRKKQ